VVDRAISYGDDLAYIHDAGFGHVAQNAATELLRLLGKRGIKRSTTNRVVDLGCGSGILAQAVSAAGYDVLGLDFSDSMLALAARRAPRAEFRRESFFTAEFPPCLAVTAIGEVFNYLFDGRNQDSRPFEVFGRIFSALCPGGLFLFDVAAPGRVAKPGIQRGFSEGPDWACLYAAEEDRRQKTLTRTITTFRREGEFYRRTREVHRLRLYRSEDVKRRLRAAGFRVRILRRYDEYRFPPGWVAFAATKPAR